MLREPRVRTGPDTSDRSSAADAGSAPAKALELVHSNSCGVASAAVLRELTAHHTLGVERGVQVRIGPRWLHPDGRREVGWVDRSPRKLEQRPALGDRTEQVHAARITSELSTPYAEQCRNAVGRMTACM